VNINLNTPKASGALSVGFKQAFREISIYFRCPESETVLFAGIPIDEGNVSFTDVSQLAERLGLDAVRVERGRFSAGDFELPALVLLREGGAVPLLEQDADGNFRLTVGSSRGAGGTITPGALAQLDIAEIISFTAVYINDAETPSVGLASTFQRRHWLASAVLPFWRSYLQVALAALFINVLALASPFFVMNVYDRVLPNKALATLWVLALGMGLAIIFDLLLKTARAAIIDYTGRKVDIRLSYVLFEKILNSSLASRPLSTGEYASRVTQYEFVREFFTSNTISIVIDTFFIFIFLIVIYSISGLLVIVPLAAFVVTFLIGIVGHVRIGRNVAASANEAAHRQAMLVETISTLETVKSLRAEVTLLRRWRELIKYASRTSEEIKQVSAATANATGFVQQFVTIGIIVVGAYEFSRGDISTGTIIGAVMLASRTMAPLGQIALTIARARHAMLSLRILDGIMKQAEDTPMTTGFVNREIRGGGISFQSVDFCYPGSENKVLNGFTCVIRPGERVGIIGRIGSGKTTVGRLLGALFQPSAGALLIDGIDSRQYHPAVVRGAVGIAGQTTDLFTGTVKDNLLMGRADASDEEIVAVARATGVDDFVSQHPRGYDMPVGERGSNLSGGQKQAVAIARLLIAKPRIVFLDEPSGQMDMATERVLIAKLSEAFDRKTTVIIATHRYSMLELVDRLIVIDRGRVLADGPKQAVIEDLQRRSGAVQ
jgi:ATP-binding cassette subfamily C protein LapB